ncbi:hypothetical protein FRC03_009556 [Tulasnella sp. 419]|nr:hypothetical protein FRC03_009556 [Tulasnella sp. 419]
MSVTEHEATEEINTQEPLDRQLLDREKPWTERHDHLLAHGYKLRPRHTPGWKASWNRIVPRDKHEDAIPMMSLMDARRVSDNTIVVMKIVPRDSQELKITEYLSSESLRQEAYNHSAILLDVLEDPLDAKQAIMVLPLLRSASEPQFASIGDCIDFVEQMLEGISFLHDHDIAHRDCFVENMMMDGRALYPKGWHPQEVQRAPSGRKISGSPKRKSVHGVKYYIIDFGISSLSKKMVTGIRGQKRAPELSETIPYDPFKVDIWLLGSCFEYMITEKYVNVDFLKPLLDVMTQEDPLARPTVKECIEQFNNIKAKVTPLTKAQRLHPLKAEWKLVRLVRDATYLVSEAIWAMKPREKALPSFRPTDKMTPILAVPADEVTNETQNLNPAAEVSETAKNSQTTGS